MNEVRYCELAPLLHYMYHGEVNVQYDQISNFLRTAKLLQVRGLTGETSEKLSKKPMNEDNQRCTSVDSPSNADTDFSFNNNNNHDRKSEPERRSKSPEDRSQSPAPKRSKLSNNSYGDSVESPVQSGGHSSPATISPPVMSTMANSLPPIPGLSLPLSMPSTLPAVSNSIPVGMPPHGPPPLPPSAPFPHLFAPQYSQSDDASDTGASDPSEDRPKLESEADDDQDNSLEKMSGLANMAALKGTLARC